MSTHTDAPPELMLLPGEVERQPPLATFAGAEKVSITFEVSGRDHSYGGWPIYMVARHSLNRLVFEIDKRGTFTVRRERLE